MNRPAARRFARCIVHDFGRVLIAAYRAARYYLPYHVRGFVRSIFQRRPTC